MQKEPRILLYLYENFDVTHEVLKTKSQANGIRGDTFEGWAKKGNRITRPTAEKLLIVFESYDHRVSLDDILADKPPKSISREHLVDFVGSSDIVDETYQYDALQERSGLYRLVRLHAFDESTVVVEYFVVRGDTLHPSVILISKDGKEQRGKGNFNRNYMTSVTFRPDDETKFSTRHFLVNLRAIDTRGTLQSGLLLRVGSDSTSLYSSRFELKRIDIAQDDVVSILRAIRREDTAEAKRKHFFAAGLDPFGMYTPSEIEASVEGPPQSELGPVLKCYSP